MNEKYVKKCAFNIDTGCVEVEFLYGKQMSIYCHDIENEVVDNRFERSEHDYLIYNDPISYVNLILSGKADSYLKKVTDYNCYIED